MGQKKILIVDDERDIVKALMIRLQLNGYNVVAAFDGMQRKGPWDWVLVFILRSLMTLRNY